MPDFDVLILTELQTNEKLNSLEMAQRHGVDHQVVVGAIKSLEAEEYIQTSMLQHSQYKLSKEADEICENGSPEFRLWKMLQEGPIEQDELFKSLGKELVSNGIKNGMKSNMLKLSKEGGKVFVSRNPDLKDLTDSAKEILLQVKKGCHADPQETEGLKKRKLLSMESQKIFEITKGPKYAPERSKLVADITKQMLADGSWANTVFKKLNFNAHGREPSGGYLHPLLKVRQEFREIFLELGFNEMDTQQWVESSFWNFDTLFVPQKHPARDAQDTFFISKPEFSEIEDADYKERIKKYHEDAYHSEWSEKESIKSVLRTHTTAVSSYVLYKLAQCAPLCPETGKRLFKPGKYFSIDRVFRNEEMDKTHLCEFHQVEGFIVDRNLSLANMMNTLNQFFNRIGISKLRFKPTYNPYTEPSMEIFGYHDGLHKWMEVGNSGVFRPEMLLPMGFDSDVTVIAWGLSLERPTMIKYGIKNIHELFGHRVDLNFIRRARIARYF